MPHVFVANVYFAPHSYGGATIVAEQVAQHLLRDHGWQVTAVSTMCDASLPPYHLTKAEARGMTSYLVNLPTSRSEAESYDNPQMSEVFGQLLDLHQPDMVHGHCLQDIGVGILETARARGIKTVISVHDFWWLCERQFMIRADGQYCGQDPITADGCKTCVARPSSAMTRRLRLQACLAKADIVTYPSDFARVLSARSGASGDHHLTWENGVRAPAQTFWPLQASRRAADPRLSFGFVGGPSDIKGWPLIRRVFGANDGAALPRDTPVHVVDGSLDNSWWSADQFDGLIGDWQVHARYDQSGLDAFFANIDVLLFPSQWKETFGLTIREALCRGIKVIQTDSGGTVEHGQIAQRDLLPLGSDPAPLLQAVEQAVQAGRAGLPAPVPMHSFSDQAALFAALTCADHTSNSQAPSLRFVS